MDRNRIHSTVTCLIWHWRVRATEKKPCTAQMQYWLAAYVKVSLIPKLSQKLPLSSSLCDTYVGVVFWTHPWFGLVFVVSCTWVLCSSTAGSCFPAGHVHVCLFLPRPHMLAAGRILLIYSWNSTFSFDRGNPNRHFWCVHQVAAQSTSPETWDTTIWGIGWVAHRYVRLPGAHIQEERMRS